MRTFLVSLLALASLLAYPGAAQAGAEDDEITSLTRTIVSQEIELAKLNLRVSPVPDLWYNRRWLLAAITNNSLTSSGAFLNGFTSYRHQEDPAAIPKNLVAAGSIQRGVANFITTGECLLEFGLDARNRLESKRKALDLGHARSEALRLKNTIDELIGRRDKLIAAKVLDDQTARRLAIEGNALRDVLDNEASYFVFVYGQSKGLKAARLLNQLMIFVSNLESGILTFIGVYATLTTRGTVTARLNLGSVAGFGDIVGGSINACAPAATRLWGRVSEQRGWRDTSAALGRPPVLDPAPLHEDFCRLSAVQEVEGNRGGQAAPIVRDLCKMEADLLTERRDVYQRAARHAHVSFLKSMISEPGGAGTKVANGIGTVIGDLSINKPSEARLQWIAGPATSYGIGNSVAATVNLERLVSEEMRDRRLTSQRKSRRQIIENHLRRLESFEDSIKHHLP